MIVNRRTFVVKNGQMDRAVEMLREAGQKFPYSRPRRLFVPSFAAFDALVLDVEHADMAEYDEYWNAVLALPWFEDWMAEWHQITETGGANELWTVEEI